MRTGTRGRTRRGTRGSAALCLLSRLGIWSNLSISNNLDNLIILNNLGISTLKYLEQLEHVLEYLEQLPSQVVGGPSHLAMGRPVVPESAAYKLVEIEGKGRGLVATRNLEVGDLVVSEKAFLKLPDQLLPRPSYETMLRSSETMSRLQPDLRAKLMKLSCPADAILEDESQILCLKFKANSIGIYKSNDSAVFEVISMINHSCKPNVAWFTKEEDEMLKEVRVCRKIKEGEEIVLSYISLSSFPLRQQRMDELKLRGFECRSC